MIYYKRNDEVELIRQSCLMVCRTLALVGSELKPGVTPKQLDTLAEDYIRSQEAKPGFKGYRGFPATLCISRNECVVHGIPDDKPVEEGEILSIDCGVLKEGFYGDAAYTFAVGEISDEIYRLCETTLKSLYLGIEQAVQGKRIGDIGYAVQNYAERENSYGVVRSLVGHGIGKNLHEAPEVPNFGKRGRGAKLKKGLVIAIEPMVNMGTARVRQLRDGWTIISADRQPSAHYEHTIAVTSAEPDILSDHSYIEEAIKNNPNLRSISVEKPIFAVRKFEHGKTGAN
jgi:methionyl aminopeptidase